MAEAQKSEDIGMKRGRVLAQLTPARQLDIIAEGLPILLKSADELMTAAEALDDHPRAAAILIGQATEELSKILILMDIVRCPPKARGGLIGQMFKWFYDHLPRLLYAEAQSWKPMTVDQLQEYLDNSRRSHDIEGFAGEFIMPNSTLFARETGSTPTSSRMKMVSQPGANLRTGCKRPSGASVPQSGMWRRP